MVVQMSDLNIIVAKYDPTVCGKGCRYRESWTISTAGAYYCGGFKKYLGFSTAQKYRGAPDTKRCAECLAYQPVDAIGDKP